MKAASTRQVVHAHHIINALGRRHTKDLFMSEVKTGATWDSRELLILDAVAMKKSWAHPCIVGYEVKVSRQDFLRDNKWPGYLGYCHQFYFVCPTGVAELDELPEDVGLMIYDPARATFRTRRKAKYRNIGLPTTLLYYMCMSRLDSDRYPFFSEKRAYFEEWLDTQKADRRFGRVVNYKVACEVQRLRSELDTMTRRAERAEGRSCSLSSLTKVLEGLTGIQAPYGACEWEWERYTDSVKKALTAEMPPNVDRALDAIECRVTELRRLLIGEEGKATPSA